MDLHVALTSVEHRSDHTISGYIFRQQCTELMRYRLRTVSPDHLDRNPRSSAGEVNRVSGGLFSSSESAPDGAEPVVFGIHFLSLRLAETATLSKHVSKIQSVIQWVLVSFRITSGILVHGVNIHTSRRSTTPPFYVGSQKHFHVLY